MSDSSATESTGTADGADVAGLGKVVAFHYDLYDAKSKKVESSKNGMKRPTDVITLTGYSDCPVRR